MDRIVSNIPLGIVVALSVRSLINGAGMAEALIAMSLVGLLCLREVLDRHKKMREIEATTLSKLEEMKNAINAQNKVIEAQAMEYDKLRNSMSGIKLQFGQKDTNVAGRKLG